MTLGYLTLLSIASISIPLVIIIYLLNKKNFREVLKYLIIGLIVALADFIVEYLGTSTNTWTYNESLHFILGLIPIELPFLFFSAGVTARIIFKYAAQIKIPVKIDAIFYLLILLTTLFYIRDLYLGVETYILPIAILIGLWSLVNIDKKNREAALILAILAAGLDWIVEIVIISSGSYNYKYGFTMAIPYTYGLLTLGLLAIMEKLHKLDAFLDSPFIKNLMKLFGIYRKHYMKKISHIKTNITKKISANNKNHK